MGGMICPPVEAAASAAAAGCQHSERHDHNEQKCQKLGFHSFLLLFDTVIRPFEKLKRRSCEQDKAREDNPREFTYA